MTAPVVHHGDCIEVMRGMADNSIDAIVTDPPYGLGFMGKAWDDLPPGIEWAAECLRVLKPGGHMLAFGGTRTWHRLAVAIEDAGFEMRDSLAWLYGSGFPKSLDVSKAIDKRPGVSRHAEFAADLRAAMAAKGYTNTFTVAEAVIGRRTGAVANWQKYQFPEAKWWPKLRDLLDMDEAKWGPVIAEAERAKIGDKAGTILAVAPGEGRDRGSVTLDITAPATDAARQWQGWGTALKPGHEPCVWGTKPAGHGVLLSEIGSQLDRLEDEWSSIAKRAELKYAPTLPELREARTDSAHANAATPPVDAKARTTATGQAVGSSAVTDTSVSESMAATFSNTVTSWRQCWDELCELTSTSTTSTTTRPTTDLRTLSSLLGQITPTCILPDLDPRRGDSSLATVVDSLFGATVLSYRATLSLTARESATATTRTGSPAFEPVVMARKPLEGTVAGNVIAHGTGALNIDGCRVATADKLSGGQVSSRSDGWDRPWKSDPDAVAETLARGKANVARAEALGRWPANVALDEDQAAALDQMSGTSKSPPVGSVTKTKPRHSSSMAGAFDHDPEGMSNGYGDSGGASRFFYVAKAPAKERPKVDGVAHPTVKPIALMRWLIRLVTPPGGTVLDPFAGSGTTIEAAMLEGFAVVGIEREADYLPLIQARIDRNTYEQPDERYGIDSFTLFDTEGETA